MTIHFKYGFWHGDFLFGWHKKDLYRLPSEKNKRNYPMKKLNTIEVGSQLGYRCKRDKFSMVQLHDMTIGIDKKVTIITENSDCPFS